MAECEHDWRVISKDEKTSTNIVTHTTHKETRYFIGCPKCRETAKVYADEMAQLKERVDA